MRRLAAAAVIAAVWCALPGASRADDANQACTDGQGVTAVVDFQSLGGGVNVRCAAQPISNGFDVLRHAHIAYETVSGSDFVCRIAGKPESADCSHTPPGNAYWSYWSARPGGDWQYQAHGPGSRKPPAGSYDGWSFSTGDKAPPRYPVPPAPTTTTTVTSAPAPAPSPVTTSPPTGVRSNAPSRLTTPPPSTSTTATTSTLPNSVALVPDATTTTVKLGHVDLSETGKGGGSGFGFVLSGLAVLLVGAMAFALRRGQ
ncbi:MAG TPA: hypothetical protein VHC63_11845 [Acidimicrobiales bacterium]|nr:hypothetical protein [Acidimicrobiales bacterium]